ncbi:MAG TPA: hypothetical protein VFR78_15745, partial [Pyrinomonadaceae bacterium]|nr:hypothetical protein [Pyrinomonadaceae bacterium]
MIFQNNISSVRVIRFVVLFSVAIFFYQITASTQQSATFIRTDYPALGNNHIVADFNADGIPDLAG